MLLAAPVAAATLIVAADGSGSYPDIQSAIDAASPGDTIFVKAGAYTTTSGIYIYKPDLAIIGEGADKVTVTIEDYNNLYIGWDQDENVVDASGMRLEGITFAGDTSIELEQASHTLIANNIFPKIEIYPNEIGSCPFNIIRNNTISSVTILSDSTVIENNIIQSNGGYTLYIGSGNNTIRNNIIGNNAGINIYLDSDSGYSPYDDNVFYMNTISGNGAPVTFSGNLPPHTTWVSPGPITYTYNGASYTTVMGNYWGSNYTDPDADANGDGIGGAPFTIPGGLGSDTAPLMDPVLNYIIGGSSAPTLTTITLSPSTASLTSGGTQQFTAIAKDQSGDSISNVLFIWSCDNTTVGTIDATTGLFTAITEGPANITATNGTISGTAKVTVSALAPDLIPVSITSGTLVAGQAVTVSVTIQNIGTAAAGAFNVTLLSSGTEVNRTAVASLGVAESRDVTMLWTPSSTSPVTLSAVLNPDGSLIETNTTNNTISKSVTVLTQSTDLTVTSASYATAFAHYNNTVTATIRNSGTQDVGAFNVTFTVGGNTTTMNISSLAAGSSTTLNLLDTVDRHVGDTVSASVTVDPENAIAESNEANNQYTTSATMIYNGYAGERWGDGPDITTKKVYDIHGDTIYSMGDSVYGGDQTDHWTASDLPLPPGATVKEARLYTPYTWDYVEWMPDQEIITFNNNIVQYDTQYRDMKNWGTWANYAYGSIVYNVTDLFNPTGNTATLSFKMAGYVPIRGMTLVVTYEDLNATEKQIFINDGFDILYASPSFYTTDETATAYAPFAGPDINMSKVTKATLTTIITRGGDGTRGAMLFNGVTYPDYWVRTQAEMAAKTLDVTANLTATNNVAMFRSQTKDNMDMEPYLAILKVEYRGEATAPVAGFTATPTNGPAPLTVTFTDTSTGTPASWAWDFGDEDSTNATARNPIHTYAAAGTYTVNLTVTNSQGSNTVTKTGYITAGAAVPAPVAGFSATPTNGTAPFTVTFTDTSTNSPTSWLWDFGDGNTTNATVQNPVHTYASAGSYTVSLTATNAGGSNSTTTPDCITVTTTSSAPVASFTTDASAGQVPFTVHFTDTSTGTPTSWAWNFGDGSTSTGQNPSHTYVTAGSYTATLTATGPGGNSVAPASITVSAPLTSNSYNGGIPLTTAQSGTVSGGLWYDAYPGFAPSASKTFTLPAYTDIKWARLYTVVYLGHMQNNYRGTVTINIDGNNDGTNDLVEQETFNSTYSFPGDGGTGPVWLNDHLNRVTSDYLMWYNVTDTITGQQVKVQATTADIDASFDGRIKAMVLVVAYDDGDADQVDYWVNQGHDTVNAGDSAYHQYTGSTTFGTSSLASGWTAANLSTMYLASDNGIYTFRGSSLTSGTPQGPYFGTNTWDVSSLLLPGQDSTLTYNRTTDYYKIPLSFLSVRYAGSAPTVPPVAGFTATPTNGTAPFTVTFTDTSTNSPTSWLWDFGDSNTTNATVQNPVHTYASAGTYTVNLTATNAGGSDSELKDGYITVTGSGGGLAPIAIFMADVNSGTAPLTVNFTDVSDNSPTSWLWDFGDGNISTVQNPTHTYVSAGSYNINLTVTNSAGTNSNLIPDFITVTGGSTAIAPVAAFSANVTAGVAPMAVRFTDQSTNSPTAWAWDFNNDGTIDNTEQNPEYTYTTAGIYTVKLTVTNTGGTNVTVKANSIGASGGKQPLATTRDGTVSGDLYIGAYQPVAWSNQPNTVGVKIFNQSYTIPANTGIQWARLYAVVYGSSSDNRLGRATVSFDGNGDSTYETALGTEDLGIPSANSGYAYRVNDHVNKVYTDYLLWYDVTNDISNQTVNARIQTENVNSSSFDGRLKTLTLVVAYNDGDSDQVRYFVNDGHAYQGSTDPAGQTVFGTAAIPAGWSKATLSAVHVSSKDATYTFNSQQYAGTDPVSPFNSFGYDQWDVTSSLPTGTDSTLTFNRTGISFKTPLTSLTIRYTGTTPIVPPVAGFIANTTTGTAPLAVRFTDQSTNSPTAWAWDFNNDGIVDSTAQNTTYTYTTTGTYAVNLTVTNAGGSNSTVKLGYVRVTAPGGDYDLTISGGIILTQSPTELPLFARESNLVRIVSITNLGTTQSPVTEVELRSSDGLINRTTVPALNKGEIATVTIIDTIARSTAGTTVTYTATVDPDNTIAETNETNNAVTSSSYVVTNNGYKGKTYWEGQSNLTTKRSWDLHGGLVYSAGDSQYISGVSGRKSGLPPQGSTWTSYPVTWTAGNLPVPAGAAIREARLYVPYTWDNSNQAPDKIHIDFNNEPIPYEAWYHDKRNFGGTYADYEWGLLTYNVTSWFLKNDRNTAIFTRDTSNTKISPYGFTLAVIYDDPTATRKQIFLNEEFDLLGVDENKFGTTSEEATAYVPFTGQIVNPADVKNATLITFVPSGNGPEGILLFNGKTIGTNVWDYDYDADTEVAIDSRDVTVHLLPDGNEAAIRETGSNQATMAAAQQFLVVEYKSAITGEPVAAFSSNVTRGIKPLAVQFTDLSAGSPTSRFWDFGDNTNATEINPVHVYTSYGTYTVSLTVTNAQGNNTLTRSSFITVSKPSTVASFTVNKTSGDAPLTAGFSDTSAGEPESWSWTFGDGSGSADQNPVHTYSSAGTYTVTLTATNAAGSTTATITISVNARTIVDQSFAIESLTTTKNDLGQNVTINTTNATVSANGKQVTMTGIGHGWDALDITMTGLPFNDSTSLTGTVASVVAVGTPVTIPITDVGNPSVSYNLTLLEIPNSTAQITMTITKDPDSAAQSAFTLAATGAGKQIDAIAYTVQFEKTQIANNGEGGIILNATIGMAVSPAWVADHGGRDHIVILRRADNGSTQFLATQFEGTDASGNDLFTALSPEGLSTFIMSSVSTASSNSGGNGGSSGGSSGSTSSGGISKISDKDSGIFDFRALPATSFAWVEKTPVTEKGKLEITPLTADIETMPEIQVKWIADIPQKPDGGGMITTSIVQKLPDQTLSLYRSALASQGLEIGTVAYSVVVNEEGVPETQDATIEMSVPQEWVSRNGGITQIKVVRLDNTANVEVLDTAFKRYDQDTRYIVFKASSPRGLCTFTMISVKAGSGIIQKTPVDEPGLQQTATGNDNLTDVPVAARTNIVWIVAGIILVVIGSVTVIALKIRKRRRGPW